MERIGLVHVEDIANIERKESVSCILRVTQKNWVGSILKTSRISNGKNGFAAHLGRHGYLIDRIGVANTKDKADI